MNHNWKELAEEKGLLEYFIDQHKKYSENCKLSDLKPMNLDMWIKNNINRPPKEDLSRWKNTKTAPSLWEKMNKDPVYEAQIMRRVPIDDGVIIGGDLSISNRKPGVMPKGYREKNKKPTENKA